MSDTLRTDLSELSCDHMDDQEWGAAGWYHARQLERELAEVTNQRDLLLEGLEKLASCDWVITLPDRMDAVRNIANETLNKLKQ